MSVVQARNLAVILIAAIILTAGQWIGQGATPVVGILRIGIVSVGEVLAILRISERQAALGSEVLVELVEIGILDALLRARASGAIVANHARRVRVGEVL